MQHRYKVGQMLDLRSTSRSSNCPSGPCEVVFCLPHDRGPFLYRVKPLGESNERVVNEADLSPSAVMKTARAEGESFSTSRSKGAERAGRLSVKARTIV